MEFGPASLGQPRSVSRLERGSAAEEHLLPGLQYSLSDSALGNGRTSGVAYSGSHGETVVRGLGTPLPTPHLFCGNLCGSHALSWDMLSRRQLDSAGRHERPPPG